jgi:prolyl-tRNA synthetase
LWQEGHTAHETQAEALEETRRMLEVYATFAREHLAIPVYCGEKSASERFPGAESTLCIEAMVQDRKAIQAGTSHFLGQNFSKASGIQFQSREGKEEFAWTTSWGVSTRLIGTLIMAHADDDGMVMPPRVAPTHVVILPVTPKPDTREAVLDAAHKLAAELRQQRFHGEPVVVEVDGRDLGGGVKNGEWIKKGAPVRIEIGPRDLAQGTAAVARRDRSPKEKEFLPVADLPARLPALLQEIQDTLYTRALAYRDEQTKELNQKEAFYAFFTPQNAEKPEIHGGFANAHWCGSAACEEKVKEELKVTIRCIPFEPVGGESTVAVVSSGTQTPVNAAPGQCVICGQPSPRRVLWAKSY